MFSDLMAQVFSLHPQCSVSEHLETLVSSLRKERAPFVCSNSRNGVFTETNCPQAQCVLIVNVLEDSSLYKCFCWTGVSRSNK